MKLDGQVETTARELVRAQHDWRKAVGNDMGKALDDTPEHRRFTAALAAFKTALGKANPGLKAPAHDTNGIAGELQESLAPTAQTTMLRNAGVLPSRNGSADGLALSTTEAHTVHVFLKDLAVTEYGAGAIAFAPRPFNEEHAYDRAGSSSRNGRY